MDEAPEFSPEIVARRDAYVQTFSIETDELLGWGLEGVVWKTSRDTALKILRSRSDYRQERDVYLRLTARSLRRLAGFAIPVLIHHDDSCHALELSIVKRPFVLDFAMASLDVPIPQLEDPAWLAEKAKKFGRDWSEVQRLLNALRQYGIYFRDVHTGNISFRP